MDNSLTNELLNKQIQKSVTLGRKRYIQPFLKNKQTNKWRNKQIKKVGLCEEKDHSERRGGRDNGGEQQLQTGRKWIRTGAKIQRQ